VYVVNGPFVKCAYVVPEHVDVDGRGAHVSSHSCELLLSSVVLFFLRSMLTYDDGPESEEVVVVGCVAM
jgi:hypothetical protein